MAAGYPTELRTAGQRTAYVPSTLPAMDESGEVLDFDHSDFENLRNAASGCAAIWDDFVTASQAIDHDTSFNQYVPAYRELKKRQARESVATQVTAKLARLETIAAGAEAGAAQLSAEISQPEKIDMAMASINVRAHLDMPKEARIEQVHNLARMLAANSDADAETRKQAREYLASLLQTNRFAGVLDETSRAFVSRILTMTRSPEKYARAHKLSIAARHIRQTSARVKDLLASR